MSDRIEHVLIAAEFEAGNSKQPATLDIVWFDEKLGRNVYKTLTGKRARKLAHLVAGDIYYEESQVV